MKIINLLVKSKQVVDKEIDQICGGKSLESFWITGFQKGIGGLAFVDPVSKSEDEKYMVSMAIFKSGLGIYCRNMYNNYLVLIPETEIRKLSITKQKDIINPHRISPFTLMLKVGFSYPTSSKYLMPNEIIIEEPAHLSIMTDEKTFKLIIEKITPQTLISTLKKSKFVHQMEVNIESPEIKKPFK